MRGPDSGNLLKFLICARKRPDDSHENYFYNWGCIHIALMMTSPVSMRVFKRYVQNFRVLEATSADTIFPLSPNEWDNMADHWLETVEDVKASISEEDYLERLRNHVFGDKSFQLLLTSGKVVWERDGFKSGGVKLIHWIKRCDNVSADDFNKQWQQDYAPVALEAFRGTGHLRKFVQNPQLDLDPAYFAGSLFQHGGVGGYQGVEEFWFDSFADLKAVTGNPGIAAKIKAAAAPFADPDGTFSLVMMERVPFDFITEGEKTPRPGLDNPNGLERYVLNQGLRDWHVPN